MWEKIEKKQGPIYRQIMEQIMREIENGRINPGSQLESERKLGQLFGVNRSTVVHALEELRELGVLTSNVAADGLLIRLNGGNSLFQESIGGK